MLVSGFVWTAATPLAGVPDEPAHVVYAAAVVRGDYGTPVVSENPENAADTVTLMSHTVPEWVTSLPNMPNRPCYAHDQRVPADCQSGVSSSGDPVTALTSVTRYPPPYYWIVGVPSIAVAGPEALYAMRAVSVVLATILIGLGLATAAPGRRWWLSIGILLSFTPMVAFLVGGVNPNGAEIAAVIGISVAILGLSGGVLETKRVWSQAASIGVLGAYLAWARPHSVPILGIAVGATFLLNWRSAVAWSRIRPLASTAAVFWIGLAVLTASSFYILVQAPARRALMAGHNQAHPPEPFLVNLNAMLEKSAAFLADTIGLFGWVDHAAPWVLQVIWLTLLGTVLVMAVLAGRNAQSLLLFAIVVGSTIVAPLLVIQFHFGSPWGYQARYNLPLVVLIGLSSIFVLGLGWRGKSRRFLRSVLGWIGSLTPLIMATSVVWSISRYANGGPVVWSDALSFRFLRDAAWLPPVGAMGIVLIGLVVLAAMALVLGQVGLHTTSIEFEEQLDNRR